MHELKELELEGEVFDSFPDQKARDEINGLKGKIPQERLLVTTVQESDDGTVRLLHSFDQMIDHIKSGGTIIVDCFALHYHLTFWNNDEIFFWGITDDRFLEELKITHDNRVLKWSSNMNIESIDRFNEWLCILVGYDAETETASMTARDIYTYAREGRTVLFEWDEQYILLDRCSIDAAVFSYTNDEGTVTNVEVRQDRKCYIDRPQPPIGAPGAPGTDGKSAYTYAQEAGYTGTEEEFSVSLATIPTDDHINKLINTALEVIENGAY